VCEHGCRLACGGSHLVQAGRAKTNRARMSSRVTPCVFSTQHTGPTVSSDAGLPCFRASTPSSSSVGLERGGGLLVASLSCLRVPPNEATLQQAQQHPQQMKARPNNIIATTAPRRPHAAGGAPSGTCEHGGGGGLA